MIIIGTSGSTRDAMAALAEGGQLAGRARRNGDARQGRRVNPGSGLPDEAVDLLLERRGRSRADVGRVLAHDAAAAPTRRRSAHAPARSPARRI